MSEPESALTMEEVENLPILRSLPSRLFVLESVVEALFVALPPDGRSKCLRHIRGISAGDMGKVVGDDLTGRTSLCLPTTSSPSAERRTESEVDMAHPLGYSGREGCNSPIYREAGVSPSFFASACRLR